MFNMMRVSTNKWIGKLLAGAFMLMKFPTNCVLFPKDREELKMSAPMVKLNTFMDRKKIDNVSKMFIFLTLLFGPNRVGVLDNVTNSFFYLCFAYSSAITGAVVGFSMFIFFQSYHYLLLSDVLKYTLVTVLTFTLKGRLQKFYAELDDFDTKIGYNVKITKNTIYNLIQVCSVFVAGLLFAFAYSQKRLTLEFVHIYYYMIIFSPLTMVHYLEIYYLAHLIGMFAPRIRLVTYHIKLSYPVNDYNSTVFRDASFAKFKKEMKRKTKIVMGDLMDLYYSIIKAYDFLNEAVKWQLLILLMVAFFVTMGTAYEIARAFITGNFVMEDCLTNMSLTVLIIFPMFSISFFADQVCREVKKLRDTLASTLYDNNFDKTTRTAAQAFLGLTEARDLSFSLFNMFNIGITLPFNFLSLLLTYLIILLQFQKVISPSATAA